MFFWGNIIANNLENMDEMENVLRKQKNTKPTQREKTILNRQITK